MTYPDENRQADVVLHDVDPRHHDQLIFEQANKPGLEVEIEIIDGPPDARPARLARGTDAPPRLGRGTDSPPVVRDDDDVTSARVHVPFAHTRLGEVSRPTENRAVIDGSLDDDWFGSFDRTQPGEPIAAAPITPWRRFSTWMRDNFIW
jgi:hypothetical protein